MRLPSLDLRLRIAIALATVCIAVVGALGFTLYMASEEMEEALVEQLVTEELDALIERTRTMGHHVVPSGPNFHYYTVKVPEELETLPSAFRALRPGHHEIGSDENE